MKTIITILAFFVSFCAKSQINLSYSLGSIGGNMKTSTYSSSVLINGDNCIKVTNSISKFATSKKGDFFSTCSVKIDFASPNIQLTLAPNPVNTYTVIKTFGKLPNESFNVMVFNNTGQPVFSTETTQQQLMNGLKIGLSSLVTGVYFVQVSSNTVLSTIKFLKN